MHESQHVLNTFGVAAQASAGSSRQLTTNEAKQLRSALSNDIRGYLRHPAVALAEGISGIEFGLTTWAAVQLYYCVFYSARAWLGTQNVCVFYSGSSPYAIDAKPGATRVTLKGRTHQAILKEFAKRNPHSFFLSQQIEQLSPFEWLHAKRILANYTNASPFEPDLCENFLQVHKIGVRKALQTYLTDKFALYTFDKDHAVLALPLRFFHEKQKTVHQKGGTAFGEDFQKALLCLLKDKNGRLTPITQIIH